MERISIWVAFSTTLLLLNIINCVEYEVKRTMIQFLAQVSGNDGQQNSTLVWKQDSDPCKDHWRGVYCDQQSMSIKRLILDRFNLSGTLDAAMLCNFQPLAASLTFLSLDGNRISGVIASDIGNCKQLTRLHLSGNHLSGSLPSSLAMLNNLKRLDISSNEFSGPLPNLSRISGLNMFLAQNNHLSGTIPTFDLSNFDQFNVSFNSFSGQIPNVHGHFSADSFLGNPELCGDPLPKKCSDQTMRLESEEPKSSSKEQILMYSGYTALGIVILLLIVLKLCKRKKGENKIEALNGVVADGVAEKASNVSNEYKAGVSRSEFSASSESGTVSQSLVVLSRPATYEERVFEALRLEDLLRAPAELIGRGKNGSLYKVILDNGIMVVVKRIKDWTISSQDFKQRMQILSQVKHPHVLSPLAFYCSKQEKLLVYEFQQNGSLFKHLHGTPKTFDWTSRLGIAATIAKALAFMHQELGHHGIVHGNLKSSNILLNKNMEPCLSEYGVMGMDMDDQGGSPFASPIDAGALDILKGDVYGFGVILLELLTGKLVKSNGIDLTDWVQSVVREEWTGEVFDKCLLSEYASEERMVNLLQVAIRCVNRSPDARPSMNQIALMINTIKEDEEKSLIYEV